MIDSLLIVSNAVAKKPLIPVMQFVHIYDGEDGKRHIQGCDGKVSVDTVIDIPVTCTVKADKFIRAIKLCKKETRFKITATERLSIISGKFRALIETTQDTFPLITNDVEDHTKLVTTKLIEICKRLKPFISQDASRNWSRSILFRDGYAYATNNIVIARLPCPEVPNLILPEYGVEVLCTLGEEPKHVLVTKNYTIFQLTDETWLRAVHFNDDWPAVEQFITPTKTTPFPPAFAAELTSLVPFCYDPKFPVIFMDNEGIHTSKEDFGASMDVGSFVDSKFRVEMLLLLAEHCTGADFSNYPKPCYFEGADGLEGVIMGVK